MGILNVLKIWILLKKKFLILLHTGVQSERGKR